MESVKLKKLLVVGGTRGIGKEVVREGMRRDYEVSYSGKKGLDISVAPQVDLFFAKHREPIDVLVVTAGALMNMKFTAGTPHGFEQIIMTNLVGVMNVVWHALPLLTENASIVLFGSISAGGVFGQSAYAASKAGLVGFTKSLAKELAPIRVNVIQPGLVETDMAKQIRPDILSGLIAKTPLKRIGTPAEVAEITMDIAENTYMTGSVVDINGGLTL
jgi:NAD(P)-dependent dehydrogenase (short-subunit alcohol dehydrogenase family)